MTPGEQAAVWLLKNEPALFQALAVRAEQLNGSAPGQLSGWADVFGAIGRGISTAVKTGASAIKSVGSMLTNPANIKTVGELAGVYLTTKAQLAATQVQVANANAGLPPAPISTVDTGGTVLPIYTTPSGTQVPVTSQLAQQLLAKANAPVDQKTLMMAGGLGLLLILAMRNR